MASMPIGAAERQLFGLICCVPRDTYLPNSNETTIDDGTAPISDRHSFLIAMAVAAACCVVSLITAVILLLQYAVRKHRESRNANPYHQALILSAGRSYSALQDSNNESETAFLSNESLSTSPVSINQIYRRQMTNQLRERCSTARNVYWYIILCDALQSCVYIVRSGLWISRAFAADLENGDQIDSAHVFCSLSLAACNFFYVASCAWSIAYGIDVYRCLNMQSSILAFYHSLCWFIPLALCTTAEVLLYSPSFDIFYTPYSNRLPFHARVFLVGILGSVNFYQHGYHTLIMLFCLYRNYFFQRSCPDVSNVLSILPQYLVPHFVAVFSIITLLCLRLAASHKMKEMKNIQKEVLDEVSRDLRLLTQRLTGQAFSVALLSLPYLAWVTATALAYQNPAIPFDDYFALIYAYSACFGWRALTSVLIYVLDVKPSRSSS